MNLTVNFGFKPVNPARLLKQYQRLNSNIPSSSQSARASILHHMKDSPLTVLSHEIVDNGISRRPITGLAVIKDVGSADFPNSHVSYIASAPVKSPLSNSSATYDLGTNLIERMGINGLFDMTPNGAVTSKIYQDVLGTEPWGQGNNRELIHRRKMAARKRGA